MLVMEITRIEAAHLAGLVSQFVELLEESDGTAAPEGDPAIARLVPDAYADDAAAAREFRDLTQSDLLARRDADAREVLASLGSDEELSEVTDLDDPRFTEVFTISLTPETVRAWLRTLNALRLVLATRLGIDGEDDHESDEPRFAIYDWLGFRLDGLVRAVSGEE